MQENEWVTGNVTISINGQPLSMTMTVPANRVKPHRMLPIFQQMSNTFVDMGVSEAENAGKSISCKAGCGACCRQPVPVSEIEVYHIAEVVEALPEPRRSEVKQRFRDAMEHFRSIKWFDRVQDIREVVEENGKEEAMKQLSELTTEYFREGVACPFLFEESCSIHKDRPVACREYLVTSPAENCSTPTAEGIDLVPLGISPSKTLTNVGNTGRLAKFALLPMIRSLELAEQYPEKFVEKTGEKWMADFFTMLTHSEIPDSARKKPSANNGSNGRKR
ncbi:MAG: YkgJ family cysteine cluster protein [Acidobacteria bacterium]|nr:YkgJ family cysteine cluster protein [Acidobacteriota bacterium]